MPETPKVSYPGRGGTDTPAAELVERSDLEEAFHDLTTRLFDTIDTLGVWTSAHVRSGENPPSAAVHFQLAGKRYVAILQPLDMDDRSEPEAG